MSTQTLMFVCEREDGHPVGIDQAIMCKDGKYRGLYGGKTAEELQDEYPGARLEDLETFAARADDSYRTKPARCTQEAFWYALEVLPPEDWTRAGNAESFKMSERTSGSITRIYAQIGEECWTFEDSFTLTHAEIMQRIQAEKER